MKMMDGRRDVRALARAFALILGVIAAMLALVAPARAAVDIQDFTVELITPGGQPVTQAGSHPEFRIKFSVPRRTTSTGRIAPIGQLRDTVVDLPLSLYGDPQSMPKCRPAEFIDPISQCPAATAVGSVKIQGEADPTGPNAFQVMPVFNMEPDGNDMAVLGFNVFGAPVKIRLSLRPDGNYGLRATVKQLPQVSAIYSMELTLWGVPASPVHDLERITGGMLPISLGLILPQRPFMTAPTVCGERLVTRLRARFWQETDTWVEKTAELPEMTGCEHLQFEPSLTLRPTTSQADAPSGYEATLRVPQNTSPDGPATPHLRKAVVTLPEGVAISPSSANGLQACTDAQMALGTDNEPACPSASRIGTVSISTPLLTETLEGEIVIGEPKPGNLFRLFLVARGRGVLLKIPGTVRPDHRTGRITAIFDNTPALPFDELRLRFKDGPRAPLVNPSRCGVMTTTAELTPYAGPTATSTSSFEITGCNGGFAPTFEAGTLNPLAGAFSPFTMTIRREDGHQEIAGLSIDMPPGLLGTVRGVPQCPEPQAAAGTCGEESRIGTTTVEAGPGSSPYPLTGKVFLAGPYKGAPFSLSVVVRAVAGPYDLGTVVVRAPIHVDAARAKLDVPSDPLPTILEGVPLKLRTINITIDRPQFMFNATSCQPMAIGARIVSTGGAVATPATRYQAQGCAELPLKPQLALTLTGSKETTDGKHPGLRALLVQKRGEAGLKRVSVKLPLSMALDPDNAQGLCTPEQAQARACPEASIVGHASAVTPALNQPLSGPVYFVEGRRRTASGQVRRTLPKLWLALKGEVALDLWADSDVKDDHLVTTFSSVPDAPISRFDLQINGGRHGILVLNTDICQKRQVTQATFDGQNGKRFRSAVRMKLPCGFRVARRTRRSTSYALTLAGVGAGTVKVSGRGIRTTTRKIKNASIATVSATLTANGRRSLARRGRLSTQVTVTFTPTRGKAKRTTTTLVFRR